MYTHHAYAPWRACSRGRLFLIGVLGGAVLVLFTPSIALAGYLDLQWNPPTTNADGTPLTDLSHYHIYVGTSSVSCGGTPFKEDVSPSASPAPGAIFSDRLTGLNAGTTYYVKVSSVNANGNESNCSNEASGVAKSDSVTTPDTTPPVVSITTPTTTATHSTTSGSLTLGGTASDNVGVTQVTWVNAQGGSGTASGTTNWSVSGLALQPGANVLSVTARDAAGNPRTATLTVTYTPGDTTAPNTVITSGPSGTMDTNTFTLSWTGSDDATPNGSLRYAFRLDPLEAAFSAYSSARSKTYIALGNGSYTFHVKARDDAGNEDLSPASQTFAVNVQPGRASVTVRALPDAAIYLGGSYGYLGTLIGRVPENGELRIDGLSAKKYVIRATHPGYSDEYQQANLQVGENVATLGLVPFNKSAVLVASPAPLQVAGAPIRGGGNLSVPHVVDWDGDGKKDLVIADGDGMVKAYLNAGTDDQPQFATSQPVQADGTPIFVPGPAFAYAADWDGDGNIDLLVGDGQGQVRWYRNTRSDLPPQLSAAGFLRANSSDVRVQGPAAPIVVDWNSDGRKDLLVGDGAGQVIVYLNEGTGAEAPVLGAGVTIPLPDVGAVRANARPFATDWDQDGRTDLLVGDLSGKIYLFANAGTESSPAFSSGVALAAQGLTVAVTSNSSPFLVDWDSNAVRDLISGSNAGEVFAFQGAEAVGPAEASSSSGAAGGGGGGCFIATAAYGSPMEPQVQLLRDFRDRYLTSSRAGRSFVRLYYALSPPVADVISRSETLRAMVRTTLLPIIWFADMSMKSPSVGLMTCLVVLGVLPCPIIWAVRRRR